MSSYSTNSSLKIFLSYAREDELLAQTLDDSLSTTFGGLIDIRRMSSFAMGTSWREQINTLLDRADVLIAITSGRRKPGHSFTGYEIGAFHFSCGRNPNMQSFPKVSRKAIPFALASALPDTLSELEGVGLDPDSIFAVEYSVEEEGTTRYNAQIFNFLLFIEKVISGVDENYGSVPDGRKKYLQDAASRLFSDMKQILLTREEDTEYPKSKLIIKADLRSNQVDLSKVDIWLEGDDCLSAFGIDPSTPGRVNTSTVPSMKWANFVRNVRPEDADIPAGWKMTLERMMLATIKGHFIDNRLTSFDREKTLKIFISQVIRFYNKTREFHMYLVDLTPPKAYGDRQTTLLQNALQVGFNYRSMFLESGSQFGPNHIMALQASELPEAVSNLLCELEYILQFSRAAGLYDPSNILYILGDEFAPEVYGLFDKWDKQREQLLDVAQRIVAAKEGRTLRTEFIERLKAFCAETKPMNDLYMTAVMEKLQTKLGLNVPRPLAVVTGQPAGRLGPSTDRLGTPEPSPEREQAA
jgi:hypothetical protein